jgi:hypothetical protein
MESRVRRVVRVAETAALTLLVVAAGVAAVRWRADRDYIGTERQVVLQWHCLDSLRWRDAERDYDWYGHDTSGLRPTEPVQDGVTLPDRRAMGTLRFNSYDRAVVTSDAGGTAVLERQRVGMMYTLACRIQ